MGDLAERVRNQTGPLSRRLRQALASAIRDGSLPANTVLPPERELAQELGVSRTTLRASLRELSQIGLVQTRHGAGTVVTGPIPKALTRLSGFTEDIRARGLVPSSDILSCDRGVAGTDVAVRTGMPLGTPIMTLARLRRADGEALSYETVTVPIHAVGEDWSGEGSLYERMDACGTRPRRMLQTLQAVAVPADIAAFLEVAPGAPALRIAQIGYGADGLAVEDALSWYRGDRYTYVGELEG
ncbi:GntR family regulatory protein [Oceanicola granulosus HTCC2516]|uniref:GntR family regulatory protein n=1 Tax=Oceanicola granulosus (strain ATCC BAA-861 / DSM 15982 / KCTC 12143 / HTCC2516) TaxID=314256 RepID=Q2CEE7_OCEGH|nr:GntR family transcriptional regulator [Oceanicola granulosus]EAR51050.1 GntR family regulatory protein [Oceanicola granulosus HTCC2516]